MANKQGTNQIVDSYIGDKLIEARYIGQTKYFDAYTEVTGTLPLSFNSRVAGALKNYRLYGDSDGSGVQTENLWDGQQVDIPNLGVRYGISTADGGTYTVVNNSNVTVMRSFGPFARDPICQPSETATVEMPTGQYSFIFAQGEAKPQGNIMIVPGSTAPTSYIPPGYKIPILLESGVTENLVDVQTSSFSIGDLVVESTNGRFAFNGLTTSEITTSNSNWKTHFSFTLEPGTYSFTNPSTPYQTFGRYLKKYSDNTNLITPGNTSCTLSEQTDVYIGFYFGLNLTIDNLEVDLMLSKTDTVQPFVPHRYTSNYDLMIGSTKLGAEEYVDYQEQKVYKRTAQLWDEEWELGIWDISNGQKVDNLTNIRNKNKIPIESSTKYYWYNNESDVIRFTFFDVNGDFINSHIATTKSGAVYSFTSPANAKFFCFYYGATEYENCATLSASTLSSYIPYLQPTDPPVPLPAIQAYQGENTLSSTETVGEVSVKGRIAPMYRQVEYLKSTGTQYIDTDIIPTYSTKTELDIKFSDIVASADSDHSYIFGISGASALGVYNALLHRRTSNDVEDICVYDGFYYSAGGMSLLENLSVKTRNILTINRPTSSWGSTTVSTDKTITAVTPTVGLCIFGLKGISGGQQVFLTQTSRNMFLYECKIYLDGSTMSNDLIPVERYDGALGLYDKITGKFYTNVGTGEFIKGDYIDQTT